MSWTVADCERLAAEWLGRGGDRWLHVERVAAAASELAGLGSVSSNLLPAAWLHDIGYAHELVHTGMHAIDGALFLDRVGAPREVVSLVAFHTGAEFEAEERGLIDVLAQFDRPAQEELDLLILADLLSGPTGKSVTLAERFKEETGYDVEVTHLVGTYLRCDRSGRPVRRGHGEPGP